MALGQSPNPEKVRYTWWYERWQWHSGPKQFCVTQVTCRLVTWCLRFYAVRSSRTAAAEALLVGELPCLTRPRPQLSWNGKRLPHARNTQSPENRNMVAVDRGRSIRYSCMLMYLLYSIIFVFEWGEVLLLVTNWHSILVFLQGLLQHEETCGTHHLLQQQSDCRTESRVWQLLSGHWQSSSEIRHYYGLKVLLTTRQSDLGKINGNQWNLIQSDAIPSETWMGLPSGPRRLGGRFSEFQRVASNWFYGRVTRDCTDEESLLDV